MRASLVVICGGVVLGCGSAAPEAEAPVTVATTVLAVGRGTLEAYGSDRHRLALALRAEVPRLVLADLEAGVVRELPWPLGPEATCDHVVPAGERVCAAGYEAGVGCVSAGGDGPPQGIPLEAPPTGLAWADGALWIATDGGGLWRVVPDGVPERAAAVRESMQGLVAGPFGLVWGNGGEGAWRTHVLRRGEETAQWLRPPLPPNVRCQDEMEVCEWLSRAVGWVHERVWFAASNAPAPLYAWAPQSGEWREFHVEGEVQAGPDGVWVVRSDGSVDGYAVSRERFETVVETLAAGEQPVAAAGGLWVLGAGVLRRLVSASWR